MFHLCFILCFSVSFFGGGRYNIRTLREKSENMLEEKSKHARSDLKTCSKKHDWNIEIRAETSAYDVSAVQLVDYHGFQIENWNMKQNKAYKVCITYARARMNLYKFIQVLGLGKLQFDEQSG